jgi:hypothetical protein
MSELDSLALVLDGTDAAIYAYGLIAGRVTGAERTRSLDAMGAHRANRDRLRARITLLAGAPAAAAAAYDPPFAVDDAASARRLAGLVEDRLAGQWAGLCAASAAGLRITSALTAAECSTRAVQWTGVAPIWAGAH